MNKQDDLDAEKPIPTDIWVIVIIIVLVVLMSFVTLN